MSKRRNIGKYLSIEASEDESEMESEDVDDVGEERSTVQHTNIAQQLQDKYFKTYKDIKDDEYEDDDEEEEVVGDDVMQSQLLPRINSPRLFLVRVKRGAEKEIGLRILANKPNICSLVVKDGLRGYLYIEAFQKQQVLDSFGKVRGINKNRISIVPQEEMVDALTYRSDFKNIEFGRIRKGKYKGDLVSILDNDGDMVTVRIVPRINGVKKLFSPEEYKNEATKKDRNTWIYKHDVYVNGFLEKEVLKSTIDFEAEPNFEELEQFQVKKVFEVGDKVRITRGELIGLEGTVRNVNGNNITILTNTNKQYEVVSSSLERFYNVGESVCYSGENGVITNYADGVYFVAIKNFTEEVKVSIDKLTKPIPITREIIRKERPRQIFRRDGLINKQVQIKKGKYKGHTGVVKDVYMNKCRIQVNSDLSFVTIPREDIIEVVKNPELEYVTEYTQPFSSESHKPPVYAFESIQTDTLETPRVIDTTSLYSGALIEIKGRVLKVDEYIGHTFFTNEGSFDRNEVVFVQPSKNEDVIVMDGDYKGSKALVLDVRDDLCIVKIKNGLIKNLPLSCVCKHE